MLAVDPRKQRRIRRLAAVWMAANRQLPRYAAIRFDAVGVTFGDPGAPPEVEHVRAAF